MRYKRWRSDHPNHYGFLHLQYERSDCVLRLLGITVSVEFFLFLERHPEKDVTIIDYGIVMVMMPMELVGSFIRVLINIMLPPILLSPLLIGILVMLTAQSYFKAV